MTRLLVSVRSVEEAQAALEGGADIIDVKEPQRGPLGRANDEIIEAIAECVAGRAETSAALGELADGPRAPARELNYLKVGLFGLDDIWRERWPVWSNSVRNPVLVAYADVHPVREMVAFANEARPAAFLIDTAVKDGRTLLDHLPVERLFQLRAECRIPFALAGSLHLDAISRLMDVRPEIIGVRSGACRGGRFGVVDAVLVRAISNRLAQDRYRG